MKTEFCERYLNDPEGEALHLDSCEECRALFGAGEVAAPAQLPVTSLPLAPWEGARHRSWPVVALAALVVFGGACALSAAAGMSPMGGIQASLGTLLPSIDILPSTLFRFGDALAHVPTLWQIGIGVSFVAVNSLLVVLLRRSPKGIDV